MNIKGGALEFDIIANNGQLNSALEESKKRVQGFSDATVEGGEKMELAFEEAAASIEKAFKDIDAMADTHKAAIDKLEKEYAELGEASAKAFMKGTAKGDQEYKALVQKQTAIKQEITTRKNLLTEIETTADALAKEEQRLNSTKEATEKNANAQVSLRTQMRKVIEELATMEEAGLRNTEAYRKLQQEAGRLTNAMGDAQTQARILSHDNAGLQGVISAIGGVSGAFSVAQGTVALFAGENENLQKIMVKVQSLMAITIGLQQVANTLNKDSYFSIVLLGGIKTWWAGVVAKATATETANTVATVANTEAQRAQTAATATNTTTQAANTAATGAQAAAATAGTVANIGLAGAFRLVGVAIKSIPVFGWILAGISGIISLVSIFSSKARQAKKEQEEFNKEVAKIAGKPVAAINELSHAWDRLGDNLKAKEKFLEDQSAKFKELGVSVKSVEEAENLLVKNKTAFINSEIEKAKAMAMRAKAASLIEDAIKNQEKLEEAESKPKVTRYYSKGMYGGMGSYEIDNPDIAKYEKKGQELNQKITDIYNKAADYQLNGSKILADSEIKSANDYEAGTVGYWEAAISAKQEALKKISNPELYKEALKEIEGYQKAIDAITGGTKKTGSGSGGKKTDPYTEMLESRKKQYTQYYKWVNSKDEILQKAAKTEFAGLLTEGNNYLEFLKKQREALLALSTRTPKETEKLKKLNDEIANETKDTVLGEFEKELQNQLAGARSILEMLNILEERRKQLAGDGSDLDNSKKDIIDSEQENVAKKAKEETDALLDQYNQYLEKRINKSVEFENQMALLRRRASMAETKEERDRIEGIIEMYEKLHELHIDSFEELDQINADSIYRLGTFEQKRLMIVQEYEKLIGAARLAGQEDVAKKLEGERDLEIMKETRQYQEFFGDISEVSIKTLENTRRVLLKMMQEAYNAGKLTADQYKKLIDEINKQADSAYKGRGFEALFGNTKGGGFMNMLFGEGDLESKLGSFKTMFSGAKTDMASIAGSSGEVAGNAGEAAGAMQGAAGGAAGTLSIIDAIIKGVYQTLRAVSDTLNVIAEYQDSIGNSDAADNLGDWADTINVINETAMSGWENLKSGNVMGAISDTISLPFKLLTTLNKIHDKKIDKAITKHADAVKDLTNAYNALSHAIENALGETVYESQKAAIENMRQQQVHLEEMWRKEESKKKTDNNKVKEYQEQYAELGRQVKDVIADIANDITQTTAKDLASQLGDSLVEAFGKGEDAAKSFEKVANDVIKNAVLNQLKKNFLEQQLDPILKQLQKDMGFDEIGGGSWNGLSDSEMDKLRRQIAEVGNNFTEQLKLYESLFKDLEEAGAPTTSLSGAIKGASQESIDLLAGQTNAVRVNQVEGNEIMRSQLLHLASIDAKVGVSNGYLASIDSKLSNNNSDPLRAQGIID
ncbi:MAG: hypothetical protein LBQ22_05705 [Bacteroidales bacterium]|jgi:hypothetical protein|nr:hypothetical protein [Bacteroidales bacterium]